ncbi:MAG: sigma factor-like helix-turn-helix DNA-binding protein [Steroidobacter sp.]
MTPDERQAIEIAFFSELTYAEAAARLNQPLGTVDNRVWSETGCTCVLITSPRDALR